MRSITLALLLSIGLGLGTASPAKADGEDFAELLRVFVEALEDCDCDDAYPEQAVPMPLPSEPPHVGPGDRHPPSMGSYEVFGTPENYGSWDVFRSNGGHSDGGNSWNNAETDSYGGSSGDFGYVCSDSGCVTY
jgi:hypothetical protein